MLNCKNLVHTKGSAVLKRNFYYVAVDNKI